MKIIKHKYSSIFQQNKFSRLQKEIEYNLGLILFGEDEYHKDTIVSTVNDFLRDV